MDHKIAVGELRYKDRGLITYTIEEGIGEENDTLKLNYNDNEKTYLWTDTFPEDGCTAKEHIHQISYEALKHGFVDNLNENEYYLHKGEYQLLKEAIVIFVSHKRYIEQTCKATGMC